jgi:outer membrane protein assembly factor BamB
VRSEDHNSIVDALKALSAECRAAMPGDPLVDALDAAIAKIRYLRTGDIYEPEDHNYVVDALKVARDVLARMEAYYVKLLGIRVSLEALLELPFGAALAMPALGLGAEMGLPSLAMPSLSVSVGVALPGTPSWVATAAYVASSDPGWPRRSKAMMKSCTHEYGKSTFGSIAVKWRYSPSGYMQCMVSGDVDGDGAVEVMVPSGNLNYYGYVYCLRGSDGSLKWSYSAGGECYFAALLDIDGDGRLEIIVGDYYGYVRCLNPDGTLRWSYLTSRCTHLAQPTLFDVDGDGAVEVVMGNVNGDVYCLGPDGSLKWSTRPAGAGRVYGTSAADVDGDGLVEVVVALDTRYCVCLRGSDGSLKWSYYVGDICESATLFDVDNDGALEVLTNAEGAYRWYCLEPDGTLKWYYTARGAVTQTAVAACDIDGDGAAECLGVSYDCYAYCLSGPTGALKWRYYMGSGSSAAPCLADLDGDGLMEVVAVGGYVVRILEHNGAFKSSYNIGNTICYYSAPALDDVDKDEKLEIAVPCIEDYVYCLGPA